MDSVYYNYKLNFLYVNKYKFPEKWTYPPSLTPYSMFRYLISGKGIFKINHVEYIVEENNVFYIPKGSILECSASEPIEFISVRFVDSFHQMNFDALSNLFKLPNHTIGDNSEIKMSFEEIYRSAISSNINKRFSIRGHLELIAAYLTNLSLGESLIDHDAVDPHIHEVFNVENIQKRAEKSMIKADPRISVVVDYLTLYPTKNYSILDMCKMAEMSESSLRRLFKEQTGKTPKEFIMDVKVMNAARRLIVTDDRISSIAYDLGYESSNYFSRCFKKIFGVTPIEYRNNSQQL